jgi:hypothetical protein
MVERKIENLKQELARIVIANIIKDLGDNATYSKIKSRYRLQVDEIEKDYGIDIMSYFDTVLSSFPTSKKKGIYSVSTTLIPPKTKNEIINQIKTLIDSLGKATKIEKMLAELPEVRLGREITDLMLTPDEYLAKRNDSVENVIKSLTTFNPAVFEPATYEFLIAKVLCIIFQLPIFIEYSVDFEPEREPCIVWRGAINKTSLKFAPGGMSDIIVYTRSKQYLLIEATLRVTRTQWETEIEPIFTHVTEVTRKYKIDNEDIFVVFVAPQLLELTYDRLRQLANLYNIAYLDNHELAKLASVSNFIPGLSHYSLTGLMKSLHQVLLNARTLTMFTKNQEKELERWISEITRSFINTFMAIKIYETLVKSNKLTSIINLIKAITQDAQVIKYYEMIGVPLNELEEVIRRDVRQFLSYASLLGLVREINGYVEALPLEVYETGLYKTLGKIKKLCS